MGELALMVWTLESWYHLLLALQPENSPPHFPNHPQWHGPGRAGSEPTLEGPGRSVPLVSPSPSPLASCQKRAGPDAMGTEEPEGAVPVEAQTDQIN